MQYIFVGLAGMLGAICRYSIGLAVTNYIISTHFPFETLFINILGCFLLGWLLSSLSTIQDKIHPDIIKSIRIGFIGAFTTFSAFSVETLSLIDEHQFSL